MREAGLRSKIKRRYRPVTTVSKGSVFAPNRLDQCFDVEAPNRVWVSDITAIATDEGWLYLAGTLDLYSRRIVGWSMSASPSADLVVAALQMAIDERAPRGGLMHHSDRGTQYTSSKFRELLDRNGIECSMSRKGNCYDNAVKESFFHSMKTEHCSHVRYRTRDEARVSVFDYIEVFYNLERLHSTLAYLSPAQYERTSACGVPASPGLSGTPHAEVPNQPPSSSAVLGGA